jgi:glucose uptake protein GlcU
MSCVITGIYKFKKTRENIFIDKRSYLNLFAGLSQGIGNVVFILVALHIGTVIASPLATLSTVIAPLIVIIFFKERKKYPYNLYEYLGFLIITLGILMIAFSNFILSI